jgi:diguanylate cyclase (GGDEF)-like protein
VTGTQAGDAAPNAGGNATLEQRLSVLERENKALRLAVAELERISERDTLTPLYNRRYFLAALDAAISRAGRYGDDATLVFCDVNRLKEINDNHGHAAGDFALIRVAERLAGAVRSTDTIARLGGDEFGIILEKTGLDAARDKLDALARALAETCEYGQSVIPLSAAFGIAAIRAGLDSDALLEEADRNMYAAKSNHKIARQG